LWLLGLPSDRIPLTTQHGIVRDLRVMYDTETQVAPISLTPKLPDRITRLR
jgi:hypothetical protein